MATRTRLLRKAVAGVEEGRFFSAMRAQILADLRANTNDRSLAGRVDPQIADLVEYINTSFPQYVTSSSCSGRMSLFHKWTVKSGSNSPSERASATTAEAGGEGTGLAAAERRKRGAFGRGTIFQSHDPFPHDTTATVQERLVPVLEEFWSWRQTQQVDAEVQTTEVLQLKFEPMILHVLCADLDAASELLKCGSESGQMKSGIVSCSRGTKAHRKITCCISSSLCLDVPLFAHNKWGLPPDNLHSTAWALLLDVSLGHVNDLFEQNAQRRARFEATLRHRSAKTAAEQEQQRQQQQQQQQQQSRQPTDNGKGSPEDG